MWPTVDGLRSLHGAEAELVCRAIGEMVARITDLGSGESIESGIDWFDQWDGDQQVWLLQHIADALLTDCPAPTAAAMWQATVDAVFCHVVSGVTSDVESASADGASGAWRRAVCDAFESQHGKRAALDWQASELADWRMLVAKIEAAIIGVADYQKAERLRDGQAENIKRFLELRGLPSDFLQRIPPLVTGAQRDACLARLHVVLGEG